MEGNRLSPIGVALAVSLLVAAFATLRSALVSLSRTPDITAETSKLGQGRLCARLSGTGARQDLCRTFAVGKRGAVSP